jgi:hypothetical protein
VLEKVVKIRATRAKNRVTEKFMGFSLLTDPVIK